MNAFHHIKNLRANSYEPENLRALLALYWRALLGFAFFLMVGVFAYGWWQLTVVMDDNAIAHPSPSSESSQNAPINTAQADAVLQGFAARQARFDELKTSPTSIVDPSQ